MLLEKKHLLKDIKYNLVMTIKLHFVCLSVYKQLADQAGAYPGFCRKKFYFSISTPPLVGMLVHCGVTPSIKIINLVVTI